MQSRFAYRAALITLLVLTLASISAAQLSGSYTIDPAGSGPLNFTTFGAAVTALAAGVSGPVVFTATSTTFQESVSLTPVSGASSTNTITFQAVGNPAILDAGNAQTALKMADLCDWFIFDNLKIINFAQEGIWMDGQSASNKGVNNCVFKNLLVEAPASTNSRLRPLYLTQSDNNQFLKCVFRGGSYCVYNSQSDKNLYDTCEMDARDTGQYAAYFINNNDSDNVIQNCFIHSVGNSTGAVCLQMQASSFGNMIWHNTILCSTAGAAMKTGSTGWARSNSIKDNIIVNLGTGILNEYWFWNTGTPPRNQITETVVDYNCYYCPNNPNYFTIRPFPYTTITPPVPFPGGNLAQFKTWVNTPANNIIVPGGAATYDANSFEADPQIVSMMRPYDIHLKAGSPCLDAGTNKYPEAYQSINQNLTVTLDFEGDARGSKVDVGADEVAIRIVGSGSGAPGTPITLSLLAAGDAGLLYQVGSSLGGGPIPIGNRLLGLSLDAILDASVNGYLPMIFQNYSGVLDLNGQGTAKINIPNLPGLKGARIYSAFLTLKGGAPMGIQSISNTFVFTVQ